MVHLLEKNSYYRYFFQYWNSTSTQTCPFKNFFQSYSSAEFIFWVFLTNSFLQITFFFKFMLQSVLLSSQINTKYITILNAHNDFFASFNQHTVSLILYSSMNCIGSFIFFVASFKIYTPWSHDKHYVFAGPVLKFLRKPLLYHQLKHLYHHKPVKSLPTSFTVERSTENI